MKIDPNAPAMPHSYEWSQRGEDFSTTEHGLTIRAYMATQIMAGIVANDRFIAGATYQGDHYLAAQNAVTAADLLIAELNK